MQPRGLAFNRLTVQPRDLAFNRLIVPPRGYHLKD